MLLTLEAVHFVHFASEHRDLLATLNFPGCMRELENNLEWPADLVADVTIRKDTGAFTMTLNKPTPLAVPLPQCYKDLVSVSSALLTHRQLEVGDVWPVIILQRTLSIEKKKCSVAHSHGPWARYSHFPRIAL